jgi:hypothetical protein
VLYSEWKLLGYGVKRYIEMRLWLKKQRLFSSNHLQSLFTLEVVKRRLNVIGVSNYPNVFVSRIRYLKLLRFA